MTFVNTKENVMNFIILGIISVIYQVILLREAAFAIAKNELSFVITVGIWLAGASLGGIAGSRLPATPSPRQAGLPASIRHWQAGTRGAAGKRLAASLPIIIFVLFLGGCWLMRTARSYLGIPYYEKTGLLFSLGYASVFIAPISFLMGLLFAVFGGEFVAKNRSVAAEGWQCFAYEAIGFFAGGILITFILADYDNPFAFAGLPVLLAFNLLRKGGKPAERTIAWASIALIAAYYLSGAPSLLNKFSVSQMFKGTRVVSYNGSRYGPIALTEKDRAFAVYQSGSLIASSENMEWNETIAALSLSAAGKESKVLLLGGGISGLPAQLLEFGAGGVTCVELDPNLAEVFRESGTAAYKAGAIEIIHTDPLNYIKKCIGEPPAYGLIIMNMPEPDTLAVNRFYTAEFFRKVYSILPAEGVFLFTIESKKDILSPAIAAYNSVVINTARSVFANVEAIPGDSAIIICGKKEGEISAGTVTAFLRGEGAVPEMLTDFRIADIMDDSRIRYFERSIDKRAPVNSGLYPAAFIAKLIVEQKKFYPYMDPDTGKLKAKVPFFVLVALLAVFLLSAVLRKGVVLISAGLMGLSAISASSLLYLIFQIFNGLLYWKIGMLMALFMLGLAAGSFAGRKGDEDNGDGISVLAPLHLVWAAYFACLFLFTKGPYLEGEQIYFYPLIFFGGFIAGIFYPNLIRALSSSGRRRESAIPLVYAADLIGSFAGSLLIGAAIMPLIGIQNAFILLATLNAVFASGIALFY